MKGLQFILGVVIVTWPMLPGAILLWIIGGEKPFSRLHDYFDKVVKFERKEYKE